MIRHSWKRYKIFDAEIDKKSNSQFSELSFKNENESNKKIAALFKKIISKIFKSY